MKNKISIAIAGNAFIGKKQIKDFFSDFLVNLDAKIKHDQLITEISNLYKDTSKHSTSYYMSFYGEIDQNSKYRNNYKFEPLVFCFNTKEMSLKRLNEDEDGFTYGIFWGGDFELTKDLINNGIIKKKNIRFFLGYTGWDSEQLDNEMESNSWIMIKNSYENKILGKASSHFWKEKMLELGGEYLIWSNAPENPILN